MRDMQGFADLCGTAFCGWATGRISDGGIWGIFPMIFVMCVGLPHLLVAPCLVQRVAKKVLPIVLQ